MMKDQILARLDTEGAEAENRALVEADDLKLINDSDPEVIKNPHLRFASATTIIVNLILAAKNVKTLLVTFVMMLASPLTQL